MFRVNRRFALTKYNWVERSQARDYIINQSTFLSLKKTVDFIISLIKKKIQERRFYTCISLKLPMIN